MTISITDKSIAELGAYQEAGALVFGVNLVQGEPFDSLIFQIEIKDSSQREDEWGMYVEINGRGSYGRVSAFNFDVSANLLQVLLADAKQDGQTRLLIDVSRLNADEQEILTTMAEEFKQYPA